MSGNALLEQYVNELREEALVVEQKFNEMLLNPSKGVWSNIQTLRDWAWKYLERIGIDEEWIEDIVNALARHVMSHGLEEPFKSSE